MYNKPLFYLNLAKQIFASFSCKDMRTTYSTSTGASCQSRSYSNRHQKVFRLYTETYWSNGQHRCWHLPKNERQVMKIKNLYTKRIYRALMACANIERAFRVFVRRRFRPNLTFRRHVGSHSCKIELFCLCSKSAPRKSYLQFKNEKILSEFEMYMNNHLKCEHTRKNFMLKVINTLPGF